MAKIRVMLVDEQRERQAAVAQLLASADCELITVLARFAQFQRLEQALDKARGELAERKRIERAKGTVTAQRGLGEEEAYRLLRKAAMDQNKGLAEIAEAVIAASELLSSTATVA